MADVMAISYLEYCKPAYLNLSPDPPLQKFKQACTVMMRGPIASISLRALWPPMRLRVSV